MNKGHVYFEIQADDPKRAINFYSAIALFRDQGSSAPLLEYRNRRLARRIVATASQYATAAVWYQGLRLFP